MAHDPRVELLQLVIHSLKEAVQALLEEVEDLRNRIEKLEEKKD